MPQWLFTSPAVGQITVGMSQVRFDLADGCLPAEVPDDKAKCAGHNPHQPVLPACVGQVMGVHVLKHKIVNRLR